MYIPEEAWRRRIPNVKTGVQNPENFDYVFGPAPNTERFQTSKPDSNPENFDYLFGPAPNTEIRKIQFLLTKCYLD